MKVLVINGSPRAKGVSSCITYVFFDDERSNESFYRPVIAQVAGSERQGSLCHCDRT